MTGLVPGAVGPDNGRKPPVFNAMKYIASLLLLCAGLVPVLSAQSLGDVAKKEEERRKTVKGAGKVYTNGSLKNEPAPAPPAPAAGSASGSATDKPQSGDSKPAAPAAKTQDEWRKRMTDAREALARSQTFAEALQTRINVLTSDFVNRDDPGQQSQIGAERQKALTELDRVQREIQANQKAITDLEDEARRAGVPPGWLR